MGVSARHTRRILAAYRKKGAAALDHGNRGLRSANATPETTKAEVLRLAQTRYPNANHSHLSELLREHEGIEIGRTTLRRILVAAGLRLVTELRLAGAVPIEEANGLLKEFLDRFNARFGVPAQHPEAAYRPLGSGVCLDTVLCFRHSRRVARDNTVKYRWRTLQLLPGTERRSYSGAVVDVLEGLDGQLAVRCQGEIILSQQAPPRPGLLRSFNGSSSRGTPTRGGLNGLGRRWEAALAALDTAIDITDADDTAVDNGTVRVRKPPAAKRRKPTALQTARWNAVQKAKRRELSIRGVARELGIHRDTAKKYMEAVIPPTKRDRVG